MVDVPGDASYSKPILLLTSPIRFSVSIYQTIRMQCERGGNYSAMSILGGLAPNSFQPGNDFSRSLEEGFVEDDVTS